MLAHSRSGNIQGIHSFEFKKTSVKRNSVYNELAQAIFCYCKDCSRQYTHPTTWWEHWWVVRFKNYMLVMETVPLGHSHTVHTVKKEYAAQLIQVQWRRFTLKRRKTIERFTGSGRRVLKVSILKGELPNTLLSIAMMCHASLLGDLLPL